MSTTVVVVVPLSFTCIIPQDLPELTKLFSGHATLPHLHFKAALPSRCKERAIFLYLKIQYYSVIQVYMNFTLLP